MNNTPVFTNSVATKQCNSDKKYLLPGNIVPHEWYKRFCDKDGAPDLVSITNLADIVAWYRNGTSDQFGDNSPRFDGYSLCLSYDYFENKFGFRKDKVRRSFIRLEEQGILKRKIKNIELTEGVRINKIFIILDGGFFNSCFPDPALDIRIKSDLTSSDSQVNSQALDPCIPGFMPPQHQCNDHISNKIKKDRSIDSASYEATSGSNFLKNNLVLEEKETNSLLEISHNEAEKNNEALVSQDLSNSRPDNQSFPIAQEKGAIRTSTETNRFNKRKQLLDFYPLTAEDCTYLQNSSKRGFNLNAMNEILLYMSKKPSENLIPPFFYSKKGFLGYMTKAFEGEIRDPAKINYESFKIKSPEERRAQEAEKYLAKIENSLEVSPESHLKKKLISVLERFKAVDLLKSYKSITIKGDIAKVKLYKPVDLSPLELGIVLNQIKATHERYEEGVFIRIQKLELIVEQQKAKKPNSNNSNKIPDIPDTLWGKIRKQLITLYGEAMDISWFSKLEVIEDSCAKEVNLNSSSGFIKSWVKNHCERTIEEIAETMGVKIIGLRC